ncbi:predicted protein [Sclerotinia sclerotiorum 1980 UF-70]|uniref:Uncharacterized protein n=1 Tax=Sclerotinia sclerotiorum (strain ATCC 18683 / 1980 / Ss-1) TaxID=665079 RepID=A7F6E2_SCLS1|nr:predicted protein [Sclerotinia sclerotiorum 1980 UF-70]EDN98313.1 predicted protein [Sclerotinia sclerotiorum 1980 UF-70]
MCHLRSAEVKSTVKSRKIYAYIVKLIGLERTYG